MPGIAWLYTIGPCPTSTGMVTRFLALPNDSQET